MAIASLSPLPEVKPLDLKVFRYRLTVVVQRSGMKRYAIADRIGIHTSRLRDLEYSKTEPRLKEVLAICQLFNVSMDWLFGIE